MINVDRSLADAMEIWHQQPDDCSLTAQEDTDDEEEGPVSVSLQAEQGARHDNTEDFQQAQEWMVLALLAWFHFPRRRKCEFF